MKHTNKKSTNSIMKPELSSLPFTHPSIQSISLKSSWKTISEKIIDVIQTSQFQSKFKNAKFDEEKGIIGWKSKRKDDENPLTKLKGKAPVELVDNTSWKAHYRTYGSKNGSTKTLLVDLAIAVYDEEIERQSQQAKKERENKKRKKASSSVTVTPAKKTKVKKNVFTAPKILVIDVMPPVEFCTKQNEPRVDSATPLGSVKVKFEDFVIRRNLI